MKLSKNSRAVRRFCALNLVAASFAFVAPIRAESSPNGAPPNRNYAWKELDDGSVVLGSFSLLNPERPQDVVVPAPPAGKRAAIGPGRFSEYPDDAIEWEIDEIETVILPDGIQTIGVGAFTHCAKLRLIRLPNDLETIEESAFDECVSLETVALPDSLETLGPRAFRSCGSLTAFWVGDKNRRFRAVDGVLFSKDGTELLRYPPGRAAAEYVVPNGVKKIGDSAFYRCGNLTSISFPPGLENVGVEAFFLCDDLTSVSFSAGFERVDKGAFDGCDKLESVAFADGTRKPLADWLRDVRGRQNAAANAKKNGD